MRTFITAVPTRNVFDALRYDFGGDRKLRSPTILLRLSGTVVFFPRVDSTFIGVCSQVALLTYSSSHFAWFCTVHRLRWRL